MAADIESEADVYGRLRPLLFSIAYRMLASVTEAEDVVQESFVRLYRARAAGTRIDSPRHYLTTTATRLCIDAMRSARSRRERYVGTWLPEPILSSPERDAAERAEFAESLSLAFLLVLQRLSPVERAVFLLHDVFEFDFAEVGRFVDRSAANCRQIAVRARRRVREGRPRFEASVERRRQLAGRFLAACEAGDTRGLMDLLAEDATLLSDGGGKAPSVPGALCGPERVATVIMRFLAQSRRLDLDVRVVEVNGQPGHATWDRTGALLAVLALHVAGGRVQAIHSIVNPDKLRHLGRTGDLGAVLRGAARS